MHLCYEIMATPNVVRPESPPAYLTYVPLSLSLSLFLISSSLFLFLLPSTTFVILDYSPLNVMLQRVSATLVTRPCLHIPPPRPSLPGTGLLP